MGYAKNMESKMFPFMSSTERPRQDLCPRHLIAFLFLPEADGTTDNDQGGNNSGYFENIAKKSFLEAPTVFLHLLQVSIVLWTTSVVAQNKCDPKPGLTPPIPAQLPPDKQESSLRVKHQGLTVIVH